MSSLALKNTEQVYEHLIKNKEDVVVSAQEAGEIWMLFRKYPANSANLERIEYRAFLQAALMAAIDGSGAMAWVQSIFEAAYKPNASAKSIIRKLLKDALRRYYKTTIKGDQPPIYQATLSAIAFGCRPYFDSISQGADI
jgi:hypothetical protein